MIKKHLSEYSLKRSNLSISQKDPTEKKLENENLFSLNR